MKWKTQIRTLVYMLPVAATAVLSWPLLLAQPPGGPAGNGEERRIRKPQMSDTIRANIYADNTFQLYINGELIAVDSIAFIPHNVISVDVLPRYPMTIAVRADDNCDPKTGMEYSNTNIGDGGFTLKFGDGTVTSGTWKAKRIAWGPIDRDTSNPCTESVPIPEGWNQVEFDDSQWELAKEYSEDEVGPKKPFYEHDFEGAKFIWSGDIALDNTVLFRHVVPAPPDGKERIDFSNLNQMIPDNPPRGPGRGGPDRGGPGRNNPERGNPRREPSPNQEKP